MPTKGIHFRPTLAAVVLRAAVICYSLFLSCCSQRVTLYSVDGESWEGKWRHARDETGLMQISGSAGETLVGTFKPVSRQAFFERYEKTFGTGAMQQTVRTCRLSATPSPECSAVRTLCSTSLMEKTS